MSCQGMFRSGGELWHTLCKKALDGEVNWP